MFSAILGRPPKKKAAESSCLKRKEHMHIEVKSITPPKINSSNLKMIVFADDFPFF